MGESIDEALQRLQASSLFTYSLFISRKDREFIQQRIDDRNQLFKLSVKNYLKTINKEIQTVERAQDVAFQRNKEFKDQISSLYLRYETGTERMRIAMQKTIQEKMNYNNFLIQVYPKEFVDQKKQLEHENNNLKKQIEELKRGNQAFDYRLQQVLERQGQEEENKKLKEKFEELQQGQLLDDQHDGYQKHPEYMPYNYRGMYDEQEEPFHHDQGNNQEHFLQGGHVQQNSDEEILPAPSKKTDILDRFMMNPGYKGRQSSQ